MLSTFHSTLVAIEPHSHSRWPYRFMKPIFEAVDIFREALELRRALHRKFPLIDE